MCKINSAKWKSIQEIKDLRLKHNATEIFSINDGLNAVLNSVSSMSLKCGFRTDHPSTSYLYPFYLPNRVDLLEGRITIHDFAKAAVEIWDKDPKFYIIVSSSPNLVEDQIWDAVVWVTPYRMMFGEIHVGECNSLRHAWTKMQLSTIDDMWKYQGLPRVRGDLIKRKLYNRRVEVSMFPTLGLYYWEVGNEDRLIDINPPICWNLNKTNYKNKRHVRLINGKSACGTSTIAEVFYDEVNDSFFLDNVNFDVIDDFYVCDTCARLSRRKK